MADDSLTSSRPDSSPPVRRRRHLGLLVLMVVATVVTTFPLAFRLGRLPDSGDPLLNTWALSWVAHQVAFAPARLFDANIFHPEAWTLAYSEALILPGLVMAPLQWAGMPPIVVYNLLFLIAIVLSGFFTAVLVLDLTGVTAAAAVSGVIFACLPFRIDHMSHLQLQLTPWIPLTMWALHQLVARGRTSDGVRLGFFAVAQLLSCVYLGLFLMLYLVVPAIVLLVLALRVRTVGDDLQLSVARHLARGWVRGVVVAAIVYAVLAFPVARAYQHASALVGERTTGEALAGSASWFHYLAPSPSNWVWGHWAEQYGAPERRLFPGLVAVVLAALGIARAPAASRWAYVAGMLVAFDVSLGLNGLSYGVLWNVVPPVRAMRVPGRMGVFVGFSLAILAGYGVAWLMPKLRSRWVQMAVPVVLIVGILLEYQAGPIWLGPVSPTMPPIYEDLLADRGDAPTSNIVELPFATNDTTHMYFSTFHWQTLLNGYSGFFPPSYFDLIEKLKTFPDRRSLDALAARNTQYVLIHGEHLEPDEYRTLTASADGVAALHLIARRPWLEREISLYRLDQSQIR